MFYWIVFAIVLVGYLSAVAISIRSTRIKHNRLKQDQLRLIRRYSA